MTAQTNLSRILTSALILDSLLLIAATPALADAAEVSSAGDSLTFGIVPALCFCAIAALATANFMKLVK
jgi:hypothetical protein